MINLEEQEIEEMDEELFNIFYIIADLDSTFLESLKTSLLYYNNLSKENKEIFMEVLIKKILNEC